LEEEHRAQEASHASMVGRTAASQGGKGARRGTRKKKGTSGKRTAVETRTKKRVRMAATPAVIGEEGEEDDGVGVGKGDGPLSSAQKTSEYDDMEGESTQPSDKNVRFQSGDIDSETMDVIIGVLDELEDEYPPEIREEAKKRVRRRIENMVRSKRRQRANTLAGKFERYTRVHPSQLDRIEEEELRRVSKEVSEEREITQQELEEATHALVEDAKRRYVRPLNRQSSLLSSIYMCVCHLG
jgi:hypothetical protein